jgi:putative acetyltransferase
MILRPITAADDRAMHAIILSTLTELGLGTEPGTAAHDPESAALSQLMATTPKAGYWVVEHPDTGTVLGGGGFMPLKGHPPEAAVCEVMKFYLTPATRGCGLGQALLLQCLDTAQAVGFTHAYAETCNALQSIPMLLKFGFEEIPGRLGHTGHWALDRFFLKVL